MRDQRIAVKPSQHGPRGGKSKRQDYPGTGIDPEHIARYKMVQVLLLDDGLCKPVQAEAHQKKAERRDHRDQPEIGWRKEPSKDNYGTKLKTEGGDLGEDRCACSPDG